MFFTVGRVKGLVQQDAEEVAEEKRSFLFEIPKSFRGLLMVSSRLGAVQRDDGNAVEACRHGNEVGSELLTVVVDWAHHLRA